MHATSVERQSAFERRSARRRLIVAMAAGVLAPRRGLGQAQEAIERVRRSVVAVGTFQSTRSPQFVFRGTGFAVDDGTLIATNAHVLPEAEATGGTPEQLVIALPATEGESRTQVRPVQRVAVDRERDLALVRMSGPALPALRVIDSASVREGDSLLVTGS